VNIKNTQSAQDHTVNIIIDVFYLQAFFFKFWLPAYLHLYYVCVCYWIFSK